MKTKNQKQIRYQTRNKSFVAERGIWGKVVGDFTLNSPFKEFIHSIYLILFFKFHGKIVQSDDEEA